jgi:hypothetical protein
MQIILHMAEQGRKNQNHAQQMWINFHMAEQGRKIQNHVAEWEIGFLLKRWKL